MYFLIFYLFITNFAPPILRATIFTILNVINKEFKLKVKTIYLLILTLLIMLNINYYYIYNIGFILSFTISFYLISFKKIINKYQNYFIKTLTISIIAFISSMPIIINSYFKINLLSPIINMLFVPLLTLIIYPLSLLTFIIKPIDPFFYKITKIMEVLSLKIAKVLKEQSKYRDYLSPLEEYLKMKTLGILST